MAPTDSDAPAGSTRLRIAQALGLVALIAGLIGALGPAERVQTDYSWPPESLPAETPTRSWYTPLLLITHEPESISVDVACTLPPGLAGGERGHVLSTARYPDRAGGLSITQSRTELAVRLGRDLLTTVALPPGGGADDCAHRVTIFDGHWFVSGGNGLEEQGVVPRMPTVYGLFSSLDLRSEAALAVNVTTAPHATKPVTRQIVAWLIAAFAAVTALLLVATERRERRRPRIGAAFRGALAAAHPADAAVAVALLVWCVIAPVNFDDGWVIQREQMYETSGGFSAYYSLLAANMPLDYWLEWVHHWLAEWSNELIVFRFAVLGILIAVWFFCRWIAAQIRAASAGSERLGTWTVAVAFLLGAFAWGMTMRPEPVTALFVTGVAACMVRFLLRESAGSVVLAAVLAVLALTAHPAGVVSLASVVVASPRLFRWAKARLAQAVTIVSAASALLATLVFVGADMETRLADADTTQELSVPGRDEIERYAYLWEEPFGTPIRRGFVALVLLTVFAYLLRRRRGQGSLLDFPASVLAVGLVLLVATPSKWPSHFGALIGIGALAVAAETARIRGDARESKGWRAFPLLAVVAATLASIWAWWERDPWNPLDLMTLDWEPAFASLGLTQLAVLMPSVLLLGALGFAFVRGRRRDLDRVPWRVAAWIPAAIALPAIAFTASVLVVDAVKTDSWTLTRQNLQTFTGGSGCGLADDVLASQPSSAQPAGAGAREPASPAWVPEPPVAGLPRHALGPSRAGSAFSPWFALPSAGAGLFVSGAPGTADTLWVEWSRQDGERTEPLGSGEITEVVAELSGNSAWRFFSAGDLPAPPPEATHMRVEYRAAVAPGTALAVTSPVTYENERLVALMSGAETRTLVYPELYLYFPCRQTPALAGGAVEVPDHVVIGETESPPLRYHVTSPFVGLLDLYELERIPVNDTEARVDRLRVFEVDDDIPGAVLVEPTQSTS